ncbi:MAG: hypothetical protein ACRCY8_11725 [Dermatophilaceae bacterium]
MTPPDEEVPAQPDAMGATVTAYLLTGPVVGGGLGHALDLVIGIRFFIVVGLLAGMALSVYTVWLRYGGADFGASSPPRAPDVNPHHEETS